MSTSSESSKPVSGQTGSRVLTMFDCICIIVGTIIGAGIFKMPSEIASIVPDTFSLVTVWVTGGLVALIGALCFAELTTTYPDRGGDYGYLKRAYHPRIGFTFSWTAFWVIRPANIGAMAMIFGEFAKKALPGLPESVSLYWLAAVAVICVTLTNLLGVVVGKTTQNILTVAKVVGILLIVVSAFLIWPNNEANVAVDGSAVTAPADQPGDTAPASTDEPNETEDHQAAPGWFWLAMVLAMFAYGGWNDIAFVASEVRDPKRNLLRSLIIGTLTVMLVYVLVNLALLYGLGFDRMARIGDKGNVTSELVQQNMGEYGKRLLSILVCVSCLGSINAMIFTGPRIYWATAVDYPALSWLSGDQGGGWWRAMSLQCIVTLLLVFAFGQTKKGFFNLTIANAPFFWAFLGLTVISLVVLRIRSSKKFEGYKTPLFPILPILFLSACGFMVYRSWTYIVFKKLLIPTGIMAGWVVAGLILSFVLKHNVQTEIKD